MVSKPYVVTLDDKGVRDVVHVRAYDLTEAVQAALVQWAADHPSSTLPSTVRVIAVVPDDAELARESRGVVSGIVAALRGPSSADED